VWPPLVYTILLDGLLVAVLVDNGKIRQEIRALLGFYLIPALLSVITRRVVVDCVWNVMAHAQKPDFVFPRNGRVHLNRRGRQFSRLLAAEACSSAVVMLDTPRSEVAWEYWLPTPFASFPFTSPAVSHRVPPGFERALVMVVMLDTPCSKVVWRVLATHSIRQFPLHFPSLRHRVPSHFNWTLKSLPTLRDNLSVPSSRVKARKRR
jgi:hypothetical protein